MNFSNFDLNLLRVFNALMREGSTVKAADRLGLTQPAVSNALSRLRHALEDPLFVRQGQRLVATHYAQSLEAPLRAHLDALEVLLGGPPAFDPMASHDEFRLSGADFFSEMLMPTLAGDLNEKAPNVRVQLVDLVPDSYVDSIERYQVDFALLPKSDFPEWVAWQPLFWSDFIVIARQGHPRLQGHVAVLQDRSGDADRPGGGYPQLPLDLFCSIDQVLFSPEGRFQAMGDAALAEVGAERRVVMTLPSFAGVYRTVAVSDLIALVPRQLAEKVASGLGLSLFAAPMAVPPALIVSAWHRRYSASPAHRWLRGLIADLTAPLNAGLPALGPGVE